jgi:hypothetical protein
LANPPRVNNRGVVQFRDEKRGVLYRLPSIVDQRRRVVNRADA